jgi:hypothetical protein
MLSLFEVSDLDGNIYPEIKDQVYIIILPDKMIHTTIPYYQIPECRQRIAIRLINGFSYLKHSDIIFCQKNDSNTAKVYLAGDTCLEAACPIEFIESCLPALHFYSISPAYLINIEHVMGWVREEKSYLLMHEGITIPLPSNIRKDLMTRLMDIDKRIC